MLRSHYWAFEQYCVHRLYTLSESRPFIWNKLPASSVVMSWHIQRYLGSHVDVPGRLGSSGPCLPLQSLIKS